MFYLSAMFKNTFLFIKTYVFDMNWLQWHYKVWYNWQWWPMISMLKLKMCCSLSKIKFKRLLEKLFEELLKNYCGLYYKHITIQMTPLESSVRDATICSITLEEYLMTIAKTKTKTMQYLSYRCHWQLSLAMS